MQKYQQCFERFLPDSRILDVGCGVGDLTARIAKKVPQGLVLGVDLHYQDLAQAALRYPSSRHPTLRFLNADARTLRLLEEPFDFAVSRCCLHLVKWPGSTFPAIARNLKPGGCMHVWFYGHGHCQEIENCLRTLSSRAEWFRYFRTFRPSWFFVTPASCQPWLSLAHLRINRMEMKEEWVRFPSREVFVQWLRCGWGSYWDRIPAEKFKLFQEQFLQLYGDSGTYQARTVWLVIDATRK